MTDIIKYNTIPVYIAEKYEQPITEKQLKFKIPIQAICWNDFDGKKDNCL